MKKLPDASKYTIKENNRFERELYARGYVIHSEREPESPSHWKRGRFRSYFYSHDPRLNVNGRESEGCSLLILGICFDVRYPKESSAVFVDRLVGALIRSEKCFFEELGYTCGCYVVLFCKKRRKARLVTDATGMKAAYYFGTRKRVVVSHIGLILNNDSKAKLGKEIPAKFGYPGLRCPVKNAFLLTPNTSLALSDFSVERFWPRDPIPAQSLDDATDKTREYMRGATEHLSARYEPIISITAGLDSRLTASFFRANSSVRYFNYFRRNELDVHDIQFAKSFRDDQGRNVEILETAKARAVDEDFSEIQRASTHLNHQKLLAWMYFNRYASESKTIHIRSNISEVGREFWGRSRFPIRSGKDLARLYLRKDVLKTSEYLFRVIDLFDEFAAVTGILRCADLVDIKSLFYWEFRMASWHSQVVAESEPAFDTISIFNCRRILETLLSVDQEQRTQSLIMKKIIQRNWPELVEYQINGNDFWWRRPQAKRSSRRPAPS